MSRANKAPSKEEEMVGRTLTTWFREGRDLLGGADSEAIHSFLEMFVADPESETHPSDDEEDFHCHFTPSGDAGSTAACGEDNFSTVDEDFIPSLFEDEYNNYDPTAPSLPNEATCSYSEMAESTSLSSSSPASSPLSETPSDSTSSQSTSQASPSSLSSSQSSSQSDTISFACRRQGLIPVREKKRSRKPSPIRNRRPSSDAQLDEFLSRGCRCASKCFQLFDKEHYQSKRDEANSLTHNELDLVVLGQVMAFMSMDPVVGPSHKHAPHQRQQNRVKTFFHHGRKICRDTFLALHGIGKSRFQAIKDHYVSCGLEPRSHGNLKRVPSNTLSHRDKENAVKFIKAYAQANCILLPGRIPGYKRDDLQLLPSSTTKKSVWLEYQSSCEAANLRAAAYTTFCELWTSVLPHVTVMKPMTDLCLVCQKNSTAIMRAANLPEEEKSETVTKAQEHLLLATEARSYMKAQVEKAKIDIQTASLQSPLGACNPPCTKEITIHYSFDFAQQVHYPHNPQQPGPIYFLTPRKCGIFGVCNEAIPHQVNYLIDEGMNVGKGANCVISLLHHYLTNNTYGEVNLVLHADNCCGQNKNRFFMQYLAWRVRSGLNRRIEISFLLVGHTKFAPDWCFGLIKQKFRKSLVGCLQDLACVVNQSAHSNSAQLVGHEDGTVIVPQYDWAGHFEAYFKRGAFDGIKSWSHLVFDSNTPGIAKVRVSCNDQEVKTLTLLKDCHLSWEPSPDELPPVITPPGLPQERRKYLYQKIREFVPDMHKDIVCPPPTDTQCPRPSTPPVDENMLSASPSPSTAPILPQSPATSSLSPSPPPTRKRRRRKR